MKKTWQGINGLLHNKKNNIHTISSFKRPNNKGIAEDPTEISDILNKHFASVGHRLASTLPSSKLPFQRYLNDPGPSNSFYFAPVTTLEIETEISLLPSNKAHGL